MRRVAALMIAAAMTSGLAADAAEKPAPEGCHWQSLPELKAHLAVPNGWVYERSKSGDALVFEVRPAGKGFEHSKSRYRLEVRRKTDRETVVGKARAFVEGFRSRAVDPPPIEEQEVSTLTLFSCFVRFAPESEGTAARTVAVSSAANARTGTLYTTQFEIPEDEIERIAPLGNALFREARLDDEI